MHYEYGFFAFPYARHVCLVVVALNPQGRPFLETTSIETLFSRAGGGLEEDTSSEVRYSSLVSFFNSQVQPCSGLGSVCPFSLC